MEGLPFGSPPADHLADTLPPDETAAFDHCDTLSWLFNDVDGSAGYPATAMPSHQTAMGQDLEAAAMSGSSSSLSPDMWSQTESTSATESLGCQDASLAGFSFDASPMDFSSPYSFHHPDMGTPGSPAASPNMAYISVAQQLMPVLFDFVPSPPPALSYDGAISMTLDASLMGAPLQPPLSLYGQPMLSANLPLNLVTNQATAAAAGPLAVGFIQPPAVAPAQCLAPLAPVCEVPGPGAAAASCEPARQAKTAKGPGMFACPYSECSRSFATNAKLGKHKKTHTRPFVCTICNLAHAEKRSLQRHIETKQHEREVAKQHGRELGAIKMSGPKQNRQCPVPGCGKIQRGDNLKRHIKKRHPCYGQR